MESPSTDATYEEWLSIVVPAVGEIVKTDPAVANALSFMRYVVPADAIALFKVRVAVAVNTNTKSVNNVS